MKRLLALILALCALFSLTACADKGEKGEPEEVIDMTVLNARDLKVNNLTDPLGIDTKPTFCWTNKTNTVGRVQTAYQIIVASTKELAEAHTGDIWDTGKVASDENFDIPYEGKELTSCTDYYWSVGVWDETDTPMEWTKVARFGTGMLDQSDWTAKWIGGQIQTNRNGIAPAPMLRKSFTLSDNVKMAKVYVCGLGLFDLQINGKVSDDSVLKPADTQYEDTVSYCVYDVTSLLKKGENAMGVELGGGFYNLTDPISVNFVNGVWRDDPKLLMELHVEYENGQTEVIVSDESWRCYDDGPIQKNSIYMGEIYYASNEQEGWTDTDFDDSKWSNARLADAPTGKLKFENMEPMRRVDTITPTVKKIGNAWIVDAGKFCTGWAKIRFEKPRRGGEIKIRYFQQESERANGLYTSYGGEGVESLELQAYTYIPKGAEVETYEPKFSYCGYQVIEITGYAGELKPEDIECYTIASDVEHVGTFESGNEMVNQLHDIVVRTMICNMQGKPTDTPVFEKLGWTGDYNGMIKTFNYNFDTTNFLAHHVHNLRDSGLETGQVNEYSPTGQIATWYDAPCWTQMYVNGIYAAWHENGQFSLVEEHYDYMKNQAEYWINKIKGGKTPWIWEATDINNRLGDWASPNPDTSPRTAPPEGGYLYNTAAVYRVLKEMVEICTAMGDTEDAKRYDDAATNIYKAYNKEFYNKETGVYETKQWNGSVSRTRYRQACNLLTLELGLCPEENHDIVLQNLLNDIAKKGNHADVGHIGAELILPLLSREGHGDLAMEILMQKDHPSWGYWLTQGATTCWEGWSEDTVRSLCHFFLGSYDEWFYQNLAGIRDSREGYKTVTIRPEIFKELGHVNATVSTIRGDLASGWKVDESGKVTVTVTVPVGTTADIVLPVPEGTAVTVNGAALAVQTGILEVGAQNGCVLVRAISGTYTFDLGTNAITN